MSFTSMQFRKMHKCHCLRSNMGKILEEYYQNGLTNYSSNENKNLVLKIFSSHRNMFNSPQQIKGWIDRRKAKERANILSFSHEFVDGSTLPSPSQVTSLKIQSWKKYLKGHDIKDSAWVLSCIENGFSLDCDTAKLSSASKNLASANSQPDVIDSYLHLELNEGTMAGPFKELPFKNAQINRFGVIPKSDGKYRLITDLSYPIGESVNDGISKENSQVSYTGLTAAVKKIVALGKGCLLAKFDIQRAYRMIAIKESERHLLVMKWKDLYFVDMALPFGARSAPRIFTRFSDVLEWIIKTHGPVRYMQHSLDDFLFCGPPGTSECYNSLLRSLEICDELGIPIEEKKTRYPTTKLVFLGLEVDTEAMEIRIPDNKLEKIRELLGHWVEKQAGTKRSLLSLIGSLFYCCQAVVVGKPFMVRLTQKAYSVEQLNQRVILGDDEVEDLMWWYYLLNSWNGRSLLSDLDSKNVVPLHS